jgi:hypothetical protein
MMKIHHQKRKHTERVDMLNNQACCSWFLGSATEPERYNIVNASTMPHQFSRDDENAPSKEGMQRVDMIHDQACCSWEELNP